MYEKLIQKIENDKVANKQPLAVKAPVIKNETVKIQDTPSNVSVIAVDNNREVGQSSTLIDKAEKIKQLSKTFKTSRRSSNVEKEIVELW